jgi:hypothetical protein
LHWNNTSQLVSHLVMRSHWRWVLPSIGLILFGTVSYDSYRLNRQLAPGPRRYYWWSGIRLDSQPTRNIRESSPSCQPAAGDCTFQLDFVWVDPGYATQLLTYSALPAFATEAAAKAVNARLGINEVWTFTLTMPILTVSWFYFVGWLVDRWIVRRFSRRQSTA